MVTRAEYIWLDGYKPTASLRSKTKVVNGPIQTLQDLPQWGFDGSSTMQAEGISSDCLLNPIMMKRDPLRAENDVLVLCEVMNPDGTPHKSNTRSQLRDIAQTFASEESLFGIEQEYTLYDGDRPLGFPPRGGFPGPQGPYYCGVGTDKVMGRELAEEHLDACIYAGISISGINAEVMPGQWEFQVGPVGPLEVSDELWIARWLLERIGEVYGISVSYAPKPVVGWNGAGAHTNFSTKAMREEGGLGVIEAACKKLGGKHKEHINVYGAENDKRLMGEFETCSIHEFRYGVSDRGASIRISVFTARDKKGYLEDRRPAANMDPYNVTGKIIETVCTKNHSSGAN